jgi:hypothetical protein
MEHSVFVKGMVKVKFTLQQTTKVQRGSTDIALLFPLTLALGGVSGQRHTPAALPPVMTRFPL